MDVSTLELMKRVLLRVTERKRCLDGESLKEPTKL